MTPFQGLKFSRFLSRIGLPLKASIWIAKKFIKYPKRRPVEVQVESGWVRDREGIT
jgi:hypothetical protein